MMNDPAGPACATDAVRYLYLARVIERLGHPRAARRWLKKAERWMETFDKSPYREAVISHSPGSRERTLGYGNACDGYPEGVLQ